MQGSVKPGPGALIQRAVAVSPSPSHLVPPYPVPTLSRFYQAAAPGLENIVGFPAQPSQWWGCPGRVFGAGT